MAMKKAHGWKRKRMWKNVKGGAGVEEVEHAESNPTTLSMLLRKWQRYCVIKRLFSFVCVKRWSYSNINSNIIRKSCLSAEESGRYWWGWNRNYRSASSKFCALLQMWFLAFGCSNFYSSFGRHRRWNPLPRWADLPPGASNPQKWRRKSFAYH